MMAGAAAHAVPATAGQLITYHSTCWPLGSTGPMGEDVKTVAEDGAQRGEVSAEPVEVQVAAGPVEDVILRE
jgi:hypothetical protein